MLNQTICNIYTIDHGRVFNKIILHGRVMTGIDSTWTKKKGFCFHVQDEL